MENIEHRTSNVEPRIQTGGGVFGVLRSVLRSVFSLRSWLILLVRIYRCTLSPAKNVVFGPAAGCRFTPSCSQYAIEALKTHGAISGSWLAVKRICRCHPWGACGCDPVPPVKLSSSHFRV